jgi:hypothetical protein
MAKKKPIKRVMCRECGKMIRPGQPMAEVGIVGKHDFKPFHLDCGIHHHHRMVDLELHKEMQLALRLEMQSQYRSKEKKA